MVSSFEQNANVEVPHVKALILIRLSTPILIQVKALALPHHEPLCFFWLRVY